MADRTYLQKRVLNSSRGPAVWALRAQTDKREYGAIMKEIVENQPQSYSPRSNGNGFGFRA